MNSRIACRLLFASVLAASAPAVAQDATDAGPTTGATTEKVKPNFDERKKGDGVPRDAIATPETAPPPKSPPEPLPGQPHRFGVPLGRP